MLKIGEFAKLFDVTIKTVRHYEKKGLFMPAYVDI
ncbi:MAG: MerR family DNA-binding transcriptional regulator [Bacilli bacterium]|nr:MerR family DNA-binding transcriptional regulator [Bacilli bacterium]